MQVLDAVRVFSFQSMRMSLESALKYLGNRLPDPSDSRIDLMAFPEKWIVDRIELDSKEFSRLIDEFGKISEKYSSVLIPGSLSILREDKLYNTAPVFDSGKLLGWQDKISLFRNEMTAYSSGNGVKVFNTSAGKLVVPVCYDIDFPYFLKSSVRNGAEYAINPSLIDSEYHDMWKVYITARSLENRIPVVSVNSLSAPFSGNSIVVQPYLYTYGFKIRTIEGGSNEVFTAELDISNLRKYIKMRSEEDPGLYSLSKDKTVDNTG
jgi:omega-amidase